MLVSASQLRRIGTFAEIDAFILRFLNFILCRSDKIEEVVVEVEAGFLPIPPTVPAFKSFTRVCMEGIIFLLRFVVNNANGTYLSITISSAVCGAERSGAPQIRWSDGLGILSIIILLYLVQLISNLK